MGETQTVSLSDAPTGPDAPETEAQEAPEENKEQEQQQEEQPSERPDWLPPKFNNAEDLARAYGQLERKLSSQDAEAKGLLTEEDFSSYSDEYNREGELSDDAYKTLEKKGLSRDLVDNYIKGQEMQRTHQLDGMYSLAGGEEQYSTMIKWAAENLPQDELDSYNLAVQGDLGVAKLAIRALHSQFNQAGQGTNPQLVQGGKAPSVIGYGSTYEMQQDMKDPRYKAGDTTWHAHVERRLAATNNN